MKTYAIAFINGEGTPTRLLNIPFYPTLSAAKAKLAEYRDEAEGNGYKKYGKTWSYGVVALTPAR